MPPKILITIPQFTPDARGILSAVGTVTEAALTQEQLAAAVESHEIIVAGLGLRFDRMILERATRLRLLATATTGLDHIDLVVAEERGIAVVSLRGETAFLDTITGTAELTVALMLDLLRGVSRAFASVQQGAWDREQFRGRTLSGKILGILGLGRLGKMVARIGRAFEMVVITYDPRVDATFCRAHGVCPVEFDTLVTQSDVLSIHATLNPTTEHLFTAATFTRMKPTAILVNTARGQIVDEAALLDALVCGRLAGYATDVLDGEVNFDAARCASHPLIAYARTHANVLITPHVGGMTHESRRATDVLIAEKVTHWIREYAHAQV